jgi:sugar/nucleoside kinase (ribokinase family)
MRAQRSARLKAIYGIKLFAQLLHECSVELHFHDVRVNTDYLVLAEALRIARANGVRTMLDPSPPRELDKSILKDVDVIKPNANEAS